MSGMSEHLPPTTRPRRGEPWNEMNDLRQRLAQEEARVATLVAALRSAAEWLDAAGGSTAATRIRSTLRYIERGTPEMPSQSTEQGRCEPSDRG